MGAIALQKRLSDEKGIQAPLIERVPVFLILMQITGYYLLTLFNNL